MASFSVSSSNGFTLTLTVTEGTPSTENNNSPVTYSLALKNKSYNFDLYAIGYSVSIDGTVVASQVRSTTKQYSMMSDNMTLTLCSGSKTIAHKDDGSKSISVAFSIDMAKASYTPGPMSGTGSMALTTIARATQPTLSPSSVTMGNTMTINLPRAASSFTHDVSYSFGSLSNVSIQTGATTSASWSVPLDLAKQIPNAPSGTGIITVVTKNNGSPIGTKTASFTAIVPDNASTKPDCSFTISATNNPSWVSGYVQGKTKVAATITGTFKYDTSAKSYKLSVNGVVKEDSTNAITSDVINKSGSVLVKASVTDKRGFTSVESEKTITVSPYSKPSIIKHPNYGTIVCQRCKSDGTFHDSGTNLFLRMRLKWSSLANGENTATLKYNLVDGNGASTGGTITATASGGGEDNNYSSWYDLNQVLSGVTVSASKTYIVTITITDRYGEKDFLEFAIPTEDVALHLGKNGNKAAFGKYAELDKTLEIAEDWTLMASGNVKGRVLGLGAVPQIPKNANLNDAEYRKIGVYGILGDTIAQTISNIPIATAGTLRVFSGVGDGKDVDGEYVYLIQEYVPHTCRMAFTRRLYAAGDKVWVYSDWYEYTSSYSMKDYITERSIANITAASPRNATTWYITKWKSGLVELHARVGFSNVAVTGAWGTMYSGYVMNSNITYPVTFKTAPMCQVTPEYSSGGNYWISVCDHTVASATNTPMYQAVRPTSTTVNVILNYYVRGYI